MAKDKKEPEPEFKITAVHSPGMTDEEVQRRLREAYDIVLKFGREKRAREEAEKETRSAEPQLLGDERRTGDLWEVRRLHEGLSVELRGGDKPALVIVQGSERVRVELAEVKLVVATLAEAAADLAGVLARAGERAN